MIADCFLFLNELDLLQMRLAMLAPHVDAFVIVESAYTFTGNPKPFNLEANWGRFKPYHEKIVYRKIPELLATDNPWEREFSARDALQRAAEDINPRYVVMSDVDEIPNPHSLPYACEQSEKYGTVALDQLLFYYYLNCMSPYTWRGTLVSTIGAVRATTLQRLRGHRANHVWIPRAGWHFSYLGGVDAIRYKLESFSETQDNTPEKKDTARLERLLSRGEDILGRGRYFEFLGRLDPRLPPIVGDRWGQYAEMGLVSERRAPGAGKVFIDGGARKGESVGLFLNNRPDLLGCDVCFYEPDTAHLPDLEAVRDRNRQYNIAVKSECLWTTDGTSDFYRAVDRWGDAGSTLFREKKEKLDRDNPLRVACVDAAAVVESFKGRHIVLKLDVEGAEYGIVRRLLDSGAIDHVSELLVEWHDPSFDDRSSAPLIRELQERGVNYRAWEH